MKIRVPASSANLGPGFDCFGIAWDIYNVIDFSLDTDADEICGCEEQFRGEDNLALVAYRKTLEYAGAQRRPVRISFLSTDIPVSRGLGSSAALIAAGVVAADRLFELNLNREQLLQIASEIEGHPDNVAPTLFGGFSVSVLDEGLAVSRCFPVSEELCFVVFIPPFRLSTAASRAVLPEAPARADAVYNIGRAALLTRALEEGDAKLLSCAMKDKLHQDYRYQQYGRSAGLYESFRQQRGD